MKPEATRKLGASKSGAKATAVQTLRDQCSLKPAIQFSDTP